MELSSLLGIKFLPCAVGGGAGFQPRPWVFLLLRWFRLAGGALLFTRVKSKQKCDSGAAPLRTRRGYLGRLKRRTGAV